MEDIEVYDYVAADTLEGGEQVSVENPEGGIDYLEAITVVKENDTVLVRGYSWVTGDKATYLVPWDKEVGLWSI